MAPGSTPEQTIGPFWHFALLKTGGPDLVEPGAPDAVRLEGCIVDGAGQPLGDALVEIWQADADGRYDAEWGFGRCATDAEGRFFFTTVKPGPVPGPGGRLQAPHIAVSIFARGLLRRLVTRVYFPDEESANAEDPVLASVPDPAALVAQARENGALRFDVVTQGDGETAFFSV